MTPKKKSAKFQRKSSVRKKHPKKRQWVALGFDISMSSIAGAAIGYDLTFGRLVGPVFCMHRWNKEISYLDRLRDAAKPEIFVWDLIAQLKMTPEIDEIFIAQEEPFPAHSGFLKRATGGFVKQQAEVSGAFVGGLMRYGYSEFFQIGNDRWRKIVADQISEETGQDITTHHSKWRSEKLAKQYNCTLANSGKFRSKQWALDIYAPWAGQMQGVEIPNWPDIIASTKLGNVPRPEGSSARAIQPDDRYDALAILEWMRHELITAEVASV